MANYVFGIDVGGTSVKCGLFQTDGTLLEKWEIPTRTENGGSEILPDIAKSVKAKMGEKGIAADDVAGVGIDVPGPVNDKGELSIAVNLNWGYKNIVKELSDELGGMAVKAANDANAAALGEMWAGGGKGSKNLVMVTLGTGVGGGIIVDGKIVAGAHGAGGEVGVDGDDAGGTLADGKVIGQLLIGGPALVLHHLPLQDRQHGIAAAEGHDPHLSEGQKQRKHFHQQTHLPR